MRFPIAALLPFLAVLAGCTSLHPADDGQGPGRPIAEGFDGLAPGGTPANWTVHRGSWQVALHDAGMAHTHVLRGAGDPDPGLSSIVAPGAFADFDASVAFQMVAGEHPQGAGLAFHFADEENHQIVRYSISENGWHLFTVIDGNRQKQGSASLDNQTHPGFGQWVTLRVVSTGGHVQAFDGTTPVIDAWLPAGASRAGRIGPFVRGDTVALFDGFRVS